MQIDANDERRRLFAKGAENGLPIGVGYFAVAFSLGIAARDYGFSPFQGFISSLFTYASAGQYMGFSLYAANAGLLQLLFLTAIVNIRYILMGFALNQRMPAGTPRRTRILVSSCITDEIFGVTITRPEVPSPWFTFGALVVAAPMWAAGTAVGISMGNILPARLVSALGVALFGMFIAVIIPPAKQDRAIGLAIIASFACSYAAANAPVISGLSEGRRLMILAIGISAVFAALFPRDPSSDDAAASEEEGSLKEAAK